MTCRVLGVRRQGYYEWRRRGEVCPRAGERVAAQAHREDPRGVPRHLRLAAGARRADPRARPGGQPQAGRPADARGRHPGPLPAPTPRLHRPRPAPRTPTPTWSTATSPSTARTSCGSPTSPNTPPRKGSCTAPRSSTPTRAESSAGRSMTTCAPRWSSTPSAWPSPAGDPTRQFHDPAFRPRLAIHVLGVRATPASTPACSASMGSIGDCYDNSMMESFWGTMQLELLDSRTWETRAELANAIFEWIECWYNPQAAPFQHRNAQPAGLRSSPHRARPRSLTRGLSLRRRGVDLYAVRVAEANGVVGGVRGVASPGPGRGRAARCEGRREHRPRQRWSIGRAACPT